MPFTPQQITAATAVRDAAANDFNDKVRVIAGPGTGKSRVIEQRVVALIASGVVPTQIAAVSFTNASSLDLRNRIQSYGNQHGFPATSLVRVSTLHSLSLRLLRAAGLLAIYSTNPLVLDEWEVEGIFDGEFAKQHRIKPTRSKEIRLEHEAFWSTGQWASPNYIPADPPVTATERAMFNGFHKPRAILYSCVLPGEIVQECVQQTRNGLLDPAALLGITHLIVDEYQDLNRMDIEFIDLIAAKGVSVFVAGDDDQSIYSFRHASPSGIQDFSTKYPNCGDHRLDECFRCASSIVDTSQALIGAFPAPNRLQKNLVSLYANSNPPVNGEVARWQFRTGDEESLAIANSCNSLIAAGIDPREIMILLSNKKGLLTGIREALTNANVPFEAPNEHLFLESDVGRFVQSITRIVHDPSDTIAHRVLLGVLPGIGVGTCQDIALLAINNNLNFRDLFRNSLPANVFSGRALRALNRARAIVSQLSTWTATDGIAIRIAALDALVQNEFGSTVLPDVHAFLAPLPVGSTLSDLREYFWAQTDDQRTSLLQVIHQRLGTTPPNPIVPSRVRVMTMHGAKGLSGQIVFVPGLENELLPGPRRLPVVGLVLEAARLLFVSITRARAACIISFADRRYMNGRNRGHQPSAFCSSLGGPFARRSSPLSASEIANIQRDCQNL